MATRQALAVVILYQDAKPQYPPTDALGGREFGEASFEVCIVEIFYGVDRHDLGKKSGGQSLSKRPAKLGKIVDKAPLSIQLISIGHKRGSLAFHQTSQSDIRCKRGSPIQI